MEEGVCAWGGYGRAWMGSSCDYIREEYQPRVRANLHMSYARDCHPFTYFRTVLLYICFTLVICTLDFAKNPLLRWPVGLWKRLSTYCTLPSYIALIPNSPQLTEVSKFFSTILAAAWCDVSICQLHQPADPVQRKYFEIEHISKTLVARVIINRHKPTRCSEAAGICFPATIFFLKQLRTRGSLPS
jgi:hypothetical protein